MAITVPVTVVQHMLSQIPVCLTHRKRRFSKAPWSFMIHWSFASSQTSWSFLLSRLSPLTTQIWSSFEKSNSPWLNKSACFLHVKNCCISHFMMSRNSGQRPIFFTGNVIRSHKIVGGGVQFYKVKTIQKVFLQNFFYPHERLSRIFFHAYGVPQERRRTVNPLRGKQSS